jgi:hypothetical protein
MNVRAAFEANAKTTETMEPRVSPFDDPTAFAEAATVFGAAPCDDRPDAALAKSATMRIGIVATVGVNDLGLAKRPTACAANLRDGVDQRQQLRDIVAIRACQNRADRNAVCVYEHVVLGPRSRAIRGVRPSFWPAPTARTDDESTAAHERSSWPDARSLSSSRTCSRSHTRACCQSCSRRQQVAPEPNPNRVGRWFHRIPVFSTNRMPLRAARSETGRRPGYRLRRGLGGGSSGSISAHSSSSMMGAGIPRSIVQATKVNRFAEK